MIFRTRRALQKAVAHHEHEIGCTSLCCAKNGQKLCVTRLCGLAGESAKLRELGIREGAHLTVLQSSTPGKTPMLIRIDGARFGIGQSAAENVLCDIVN